MVSAERVEFLESWLVEDAATFGELLAQMSEPSGWVDRGISDLLFAGMTPEQVAALLPANVAEAKRKELGIGHRPKTQSTVQVRTSATRENAPVAGGSTGSLMEAARERMATKHQSMVLRAVISHANSSQVGSPITPTTMSEALHVDEQFVIHENAVGKSLRLLEELGVLRQIGRGRYLLTDRALSEIRS